MARFLAFAGGVIVSLVGWEAPSFDPGFAGATALAQTTAPADSRSGGEAEERVSMPDREPDPERAVDASAEVGADDEVGSDDEARAHPIDRRPMPDLDGRPPPAPSPRRRAAWVPRVLLAPLFVAAEYLIRRPLIFLASKIIQNRLPSRVVDWFTFGPRDRIFLAPAFGFDVGLRSAVGLLFRFEELGLPSHTLTASGTFGGVERFTASLASRIRPEGKPWRLAVGMNVDERFDARFFGLGSEASNDNRARFERLNVLGQVRFDVDWGLSAWTVRTGVQYASFGDDVGDDRSIDELVGLGPEEGGGIQRLPPAYPDGFTAWRSQLDLRVDTRPARGDGPLTGVRFHVGADTGLDLRERAEQGAWVTMSGSVAGHWDMSGAGHVVSLEVSGALTEDIRGEAPFTELTELSGSGPLRGFGGGWLVGPSAAATVFAYHWPIWHILDGSLQIAVGNVFDERWKGFGVEKMRLSVAMGVATVGARDHGLELLFGFGTDTFEGGMNVQFARVAFGTSSAL